MSFCQVQLIGNIGRDAELSYTPQGIAVTKFSVAISRKVGEKEETTWYNCTAWRKLAEQANEYCTKGRQVFVQGSLSPRTYTTRDGKQGISMDVTVERFELLGSKPPTQGTANSHDDIEDMERPF